MFEMGERGHHDRGPVGAERVLPGDEGIVGEKGVAISNLKPNGEVRVHGEIWNAISSEQIKKGDEVTVTKVDGLILEVENKNGGKRL